MTEAHHQEGLWPQPDASADQAGTDAPPDGSAPRDGSAPPDGSPPDGMSWSWEPDLDALLAAVTGPAPWQRGPRTPSQPATSAQSSANPAPEDTSAATEPDAVEAEFAEYLEAVEAGQSPVIPLTTVAGRIAESVPAGPELAAWADTGPVTGLEDGALAGIAMSYRRLASWAQAGELAAVAELTARSAAADDRIGIDEQGCPARIPDSASAEVSLALTMSQSAASWWTDLAVTLRWRLAETGAALRSGTIDLARARAIAEATAALDEDTARSVQDRVLPRAGNQTLGRLRAALRRAVIAADPAGADRRREEAERRARVMLYPDPDGTASLAGYNLPGINATAAMARVTALARALKTSGAGGGIDLLRAQVFLGLLLGTLPYIPPPEDAPPDDNDPPDPEPPDPEPPHDNDPPDTGEPPHHHEPPGNEPPGNSPPDDEPLGDEPPDDGLLLDNQPDYSQPDYSQPDYSQPDYSQPGDDLPLAGAGVPEQRAAEQRAAGGSNGAGRGFGGCGFGGCGFGGRGFGGRDGPGVWEADDLRVSARPPPAWPPVLPFLQPGPAAMGGLPPAGGGLLDLRVPWTTLTGQSPEPGYLGRLGPITPGQAAHLTALAARDPAVRWRVIVTDQEGRAIAVTRLTAPARARRTAAASPAGLVGQITVTIGSDYLTGPADTVGLPPALSQVLAAARSTAAETAQRARADTQHDGCAHTEATPAYRPATRLWDYIISRDVTCRFLTCRQPAIRCDLDHTTPFDQGGPTCWCNLGAICRYHHRKIKQHPGWHLNQPTPGTFTWTTPTGRTYAIQPDTHVA